ncbi:hypothetical protein TruAng_009705 [Truncatella angustata]|nr:hypothetical protein TruAng_009705 [Truncatella angustata]
MRRISESLLGQRSLGRRRRADDQVYDNLFQLHRSPLAAEPGRRFCPARSCHFPYFDWAIQVFDLDLSFSSVFFLWLHAGVSADQGKPQPLSVTSAFFNITRAAAAGSASNATATSSAVASTSTPAVMVTATSAPAIGEDGSGQVDGLSTGAKAGIGIGASLAVCGAVTAVYFCLRKKIRASADQANRTKDEVEGTRPIDGAVHEKPVDTGLTELDGQQEYQHHISPIKRTPVELSQD